MSTTIVLPRENLDGAPKPPKVKLKTSPKQNKALKKAMKKAEKKAASKKAAQKKAAKKAKGSWSKRLSGKTKRFFKKSWSSVRSVLRKLREKIAKAARYTKAKAQAGRARTGNVVRRFWTWAWSGTKSSWAWSRSAVVGTWQFTGPFRSWVATPFRLAFGTSAGLVTLLTFGGKAIMLVALPWIAFLLLSGRMVMIKNGKIKSKKAKKSQAKKGKHKAVKAKKVVVVEGVEIENGLVLTEPQRNALDSRMTDVRDSGERWADKDNKQKVSEYTGRMHLLQMRMAGSTESATVIAEEWRAHVTAELGEEGFRDTFIWTHANKGIQDENKLVKKILETTTAIEPEPAAAS
jgi:hypothetical protein